MSFVGTESPLALLLLTPLLTVGVLVVSSFVARSGLGFERLPDEVWRIGGLAGASLTLVIALLLILAPFDPEHLGLQMVERRAWLPALGAHLVLGVDGVNLHLVMLTALLQPVVLLATWNQVERGVAEFVACSLLLETALLGLLLSLNLLLFYFFWELTALTLYFLTSIWGRDTTRRSAETFIAHSALGSGLMLAGIVGLATLSAAQGGAPNLDILSGDPAAPPHLLLTYIAASSTETPWYHTQPWLFGAFAAAFAVRVPLFPLHTWLAKVLRDTPIAVSALVAGSFLSTGVYGFLRFALPLFPDAAADFAPIAFGIAALGVVYGGALALVQDEARRLLAFAVLAQLGLSILGVFSLNVQGLAGSLVQLVALGLGSATLFILFGALEERRGTLHLDGYGGLAKPMPVLTMLLGLTVLSVVGVPMLGGFVGEWLVLLGAFQAHPARAAMACVGVALVAGSLLRVLSRISLGPVDTPENRGLIDLDWRERIACLLLIVPLCWIGVYPNGVLRRIEPSVLELLAQMDQRSTALPSASPTRMPDTESPTDDEPGNADAAGEAI